MKSILKRYVGSRPPSRMGHGMAVALVGIFDLAQRGDFSGFLTR